MVEKDPSSTSKTEDGGGKPETAQFDFYDGAKEGLRPTVSPGHGELLQPNEKVGTKKSKHNKVNQSRKKRRGARPSTAPAGDGADGDGVEAEVTEAKSNGKGEKDANPSKGSATDNVNKVDSKPLNVDEKSHEETEKGAKVIERSTVDGDNRQAEIIQAKGNGMIEKGPSPISKSSTNAEDRGDPEEGIVDAKSYEEVGKDPTHKINSATNGADGDNVEPKNVQIKSDGKNTNKRKKQQRKNGTQHRNKARSGEVTKEFLVESEDDAPSSFEKTVWDGDTENPFHEVSASRAKRPNKKGNKTERRTKGGGRRETKNVNKNTNLKQDSGNGDKARKEPSAEGDSSNEIIVTIIEGDENNRKCHLAISSKAAEINAKKDPESNLKQQTIRLREKTAKNNATKPNLNTGCKEDGKELKSTSEETSTLEGSETKPNVEVGREHKLLTLPKQSDAKGQSQHVNNRTQQRTRNQRKKELKHSQMDTLEGNDGDNLRDMENSLRKSSIKGRKTHRNTRNNQRMKGMRPSSANVESIENNRLDKETETKFRNKDHQESNTDVELIRLKVEKKELPLSDYEKMITTLDEELKIAKDLNKIMQDERDNACKTISLQMTKLNDLELKLASMETEKADLVAELATVVEQLKEEKKLRDLIYSDLGRVKELELKLKNESAARVSVEKELRSVRDKLECLDTNRNGQED